ncbi:MAG: dienelactone hydrolase family protein [Bacteroidia bacterium]
MKKIFFIAIAIIASSFFQKSNAQSNRSCCVKPATTEFAMLGKEESFKDAHLSPVPFNYVPHGGKMISITCLDGRDANAFEIKAEGNNHKYLFVIHEWWGLNDYVKQEAEKLFHDLKDVTVIALDLFDGKTCTNADSAAQLMQTADEQRIRTILNGASDYAGSKARIQTLGWCFGGGWSLQASIQLGEKAAGCVIYYGYPEKDRKKLGTLKAPVLGLFAKQDGWITPEIVNAFEKNLNDLKIPHTVKSFDADHAFANPSNPKHDSAATAEANKLALDFLKKNSGK